MGDGGLMWRLVCLVPGNPPYRLRELGKGGTGTLRRCGGAGVHILDLVHPADGNPFFCFTALILDPVGSEDP